MMKSIPFFSLLAITFFAQSCDECKRTSCPQDIEFGSCIPSAFPFVVGDSFTYVSDTYDTLHFKVSEKNFVRREGTDFDKEQLPCCDSYLVDEMSIRMSNETGALISIFSHSDGFPRNVTINIQVDSNEINDSWYLPEDCEEGEGLDLISVNLAGVEFHDVLSPFENDPPIFLAPKAGCIVGFKLDGKEYRKI